VAPASATAASKLPVIVWYHGGANIAGGADIDIMDTSDLARRDVVVVSAQYRLGVMGCLEIDGIAPANLHVLDQIAALQWVHDHVASFGGDPEQVTIQGQSAGGCAVYNLLFAAGTEHLYKRAIMQSAPLGILHSSGKDAALTAKRAFELLGGSAEAAAQKSSDDILDVQRTLVEEQKARGGTIGFWPTWGKHPLPPVAEIDARIQTLAKQKDLFIGWTADDCMPFIQLSPYAPTLNALPIIGTWTKLAISRVATNYVFKRGSQQLHQKWLKAGGNSTSFAFEWYPAGSPLRACHCIDMPFLFADWDTWSNAPLVAYGEGSKEIVERLAPDVKDVFVHFAKSGLKSNTHLVVDERFSAAKHI
jgi:para-nitrobenzyl esterase